MTWTLSSLKTAIQDYSESTETSFVTNLPNFIKTAEERYKAKNFKTEADKVAADDWMAKQQMIADEIDSRNQREILKQALLYSGTGVTGAALVGEGVEQIRRAD